MHAQKISSDYTNKINYFCLYTIRDVCLLLINKLQKYWKISFMYETMNAEFSDANICSSECSYLQLFLYLHYITFYENNEL